MNTKTIAIIIVAIVVVAAVGICAYAFIGDDEEERINTSETALVYGNANHDYAIDELDVEFLQDIVDGTTEWDKDENWLADANCDGEITQSDIDLVNKIINDEACNVYYYNYFGEAQEISYPLKDKKLAVTYWQQAEEVAILGLWDNVVVANASVMSRDNLYDLSNVVSIGNSSGSALDEAQVETILDEGVEVIIGSAYDSVRTYADPLKEYGVETIYLWHAGNYCISTILTLGILLDEEEAAEKFVQYCVDIQELIDERIGDSDRPTVVITMVHGDNEDRYISSYGGIFTSVNDPAGEWYLIGQIADVYTTDVTGSKTLGRNYYSIEWFIENPFDYIVVMGSGVSADTREDYDAWFERNVEKYYGQTYAYSRGNVLGVTYSFGGFSGYALMGIIAWMIYPDLFTYEEVHELRQYYYDNFTDLQPDCDDLPMYYLGSEYDASYL